MDLMSYLVAIPLPFLIVAVLIVVGATVYMVVQYAKLKGLDGIREDVYQLILKAEHMYEESGTGKQKFKWVVSQARMLLPDWLQIIITETMLENIVQSWFEMVKDLLDDGKVNQSQRE